MKIIDSTPEILKCYVGSTGPKRNRIKLRDEQKYALEAIFLKNQHPTETDKYFLESKYFIPIKSIIIWFQNRRAKEKAKLYD